MQRGLVSRGGHAVLQPMPPHMPCGARAGTAARRHRLEAASTAEASTRAARDENQSSREGSHEAPLVQQQAGKVDPEQESIAGVLTAFDAAAATADVAVVGCGPAGLALAAQLARQGLGVVLVGRDSRFVNNYGVWLDEFEDLGLRHTLNAVWDDAVCYFQEGAEVRVGRAYGRVCRRRLRKQLLQDCADAGVAFFPAEVEDIQAQAGAQLTSLRCAGGAVVRCRLATLASGAAGGRFLRFEEGAPAVAAQTAYGIEAEVEGYSDAYDPSTMLFMDFRRHHTGLYDGTATKQKPGKHPNGAAGLWGTEGEVPSFLYAMPLGGNRVFLEETCLVARPALPFAVLKRRLERRCRALGLKIKEVHEEEWSYIPVGGPLPLPEQPVAAFGAAANLVHPATGYSLTRSLREAPAMAAAVKAALEEEPDSAAVAARVWGALWTPEKRRQTAFHVFGMELLCQLDVANTADFFVTFFRLPARYWRGFLASQLSSLDLVGFALATFALAPFNIQAKLVGHLATDPVGQYLIRTYTKKAAQEE